MAFYEGESARIKHSCRHLKYRGCIVKIIGWSGGTYSHKEQYYVVELPNGVEGLISASELEQI